ncbi:MAG TPA: neutral zinc metallopeptidase [Sporichthyaceae bacterium]|nr:neutral zinc metallopeptidase [Sporichthyaceae bacterium]
MRRGGLIGVVVAVVLTVAPMPTARAEDGLDYPRFVAFEQSVADDVDSFWTSWSQAHASAYHSAHLVLVPAAETHNSGCGVAAADPRDGAEDASPAFYCPRDDTVYLSAGWLYRAIYQRFGDLAAAVAVAHEWAHHVQTLDKLHPPSVMFAELQADCWAGVWVHDADVRDLLDPGDLPGAGQALYALGDYAYRSADHHGTPRQRLRELTVGYRVGDPAQCDIPTPRRRISPKPSPRTRG